MDATDVARQRPVGLADLARIPLRRWRTVLVSMGLLLLLVVAYLVLVPAVYTATTVVVVRPVVTDPFSLPAGGADRAVNMTAESGIATSNDVVDRVAVITGRDAEDVGDALKVETPVGGQLMRFTYAGQSEREAVAGANGAAETYLNLRKGMYEDQRAAVLKSYDDTIALVTTQRTTTQKELPTQGGGGSSPRTSALLDQIRALNDQLAQLAEQRSKIASADLSPGSVTSAAREPVPSNRDAALLFVLAALLGGALVGALAAFVREAMDRRVRSAHEASELIGAPLIGSVHRSGKGDSAMSDMRYLALALTQWVERPRPVPLVLLSSAEDEGRAQVSAGLAAALAESGHEVRLGGSPESLEQIRPLLLAAQRRVPPTVPVPRPRTANPAPAAPPQADGVPVVRPVDGSAAPRSMDDTVQISAVRKPRPGEGGPSGSPDDTVLITPVRKPRPGEGGPSGSPDDTVLITPVRKPRPSPGPDPKNGAVYRSGTAVEPPKPSAPTPTASASVSVNPATTAPDDDRTIRIGGGVVRLIRDLDSGDDKGLVLLDAPAATRDDRGVRIARDGFAVLVAARDRTRTAQLGRLIERLRAAGVTPVGFVLTGDGRD